MTQQSNPQIDFGFYAAIPRIIRTAYKPLTPLQKWLYVCLKDLCGDHGVCFRTMRALAEETGLSLGELSKSIPVLHSAGLIHAEKKRRSNNPTAKEVWHITIVDIWQANGKAHPVKRSQDEQQCSPREQSTENVHRMNNNVHHVNSNALECSQDEQQCSPREPAQSYKPAPVAGSSAQKRVVRKNIEERTIIEERTLKEIGVTQQSSTAPILEADASPLSTLADDDETISSEEVTQAVIEAHQSDSYSPPQAEPITTKKEMPASAGLYDIGSREVDAKGDASPTKATRVGEKPARRGKKGEGVQTPPDKAKKQPKDPLADVSPAARVIITEWTGIFNKPMAVTATMVGHATTLAQYEPEPGEIVKCRLWMFAQDKNNWYRTKGLHLGDVVKDFERWRSLGCVPTSETKPTEASPTPGSQRGYASPAVRRFSSFDDPSYDMSNEFYPSEAQKIAARSQQHAAF